jgi:5'-3' exonuclease
MGTMPPRRGVTPSKRGSGIVIDKKPNVLLVDGNALYKTGYHGAKNEFNSRGEHIGGVYQFITVLRKLLNENLYHKVFVFWDGEFSGKLRHFLYPHYKLNRGKDYVNGTRPEDDKDQIIERAMVQEYLEELFIRQLEDKVVEADDFIAYYCKKKKQSENITIVSNDRDLCQLIDDNVRMYLCDKKVFITLDNYQEYFTHKKENSVLIKVMSGDSSDNIKGIQGVKEKTLLKYFPELTQERLTIDDVVKKAELIQENRKKEKKKPLKALHNIIYGVTDGIQGSQLYEINNKLVDLSYPLVTPEAQNEIDNLMDTPLSTEDRGIKNAYMLMKRDGIDRLINNMDYLLPFKKLIEREKNFNNKN